VSIIPVQRWTIIPVTPPQVLLHCSACRATRAFVSSGKIRLNANGKILDAWLIYRCSSCDTTWNRTIFERRNVNTMSHEEMAALHHSDPDYVASVAFNVAGLRCTDDDSLSVMKEPSQVSSDGTFEIVFAVPVKVPVRLDRLLARELGLSRRIVEAISEPKSALRKPVRDGLRVVIRRAITPSC
jgi:hypothetical protein